MEKKMNYIKAFQTNHLPPGDMKSVKLGKKEILVANLDGEYFAIDNKCSHLGGSLAKGDLEENIVTCPRHGAEFDVKNGSAVGKAKIAVLKMGVKDLVSFPVKVEGLDVLIGFPE
jgi:3-phenylpropionate/trans-cinnamate dioxygenase ferredoxin subunit